jgi:glutathione peroxidase
MLQKLRKAVRTATNRVVYGKPPEGGPESLADIALTRLDGSSMPLTELDGKVVMFVNVASRCGLTPQYAGLVALHQRFKDRGLVLVGVPCNQFLGQEPGSADEIALFCSTKYGVEFPLLAKQNVNGTERSPLYQWLVGSEAGRGEDIGWNFEKFLLGRDGEVLARFAPTTKPDAPELIAAIEAALG